MAVARSSSRVARRRWRQKGLLTALGLVFAVSALLRLGSLESAFADGGGAGQTMMPPPSLADAADLPEGRISMAPLVDALADVEALRDDLAAREAALIDRERAVAAAQVLAETRLAELEAAETRLRDLIALSDGAAEADLDRLTRVYETMDPDQAAPLFSQMAPSFAAGFMARMTPAASAAIMAELAPEEAYAISVILATRNASAPVLDDQSSVQDTQN
jgi:flagellar motility protein MotE (MotC chaperone)